MRPALVIFDCDGVLVDSEPLAERALIRALDEIGLRMDAAEIRDRFQGRSFAHMLGVVEDLHGAPLPSDWAERLRQHDLDLFEAELQPIDGVREAVLSIRAAGLPFCVASSGTVEKMTFTLGLTRLLPLMGDRLFSATMVRDGKPAPDLFLFAADRMGAAPNRCVVIEDSVAGTQAGHAAGMRVLSYAGSPHADPHALTAAGGEVFTRMAALPGLIGLPADG